MLPATHRRALQATARVACLATALAACGPKKAPAETTATATEPDATEPDAAPAERSAEECLAITNDHAEGKALPADVSKADVKTCCEVVAQDLDADGLTGMEAWTGRNECCEMLDWMGSMACTPWGPPTPPAMPRGQA